MPELPEVETVRRGLMPHLAGARIERVTLNRPNLRFAFPEKFAARLEGQVIKQVNRRAKYLLFELGGGETLLSHLGMTGNYRIVDGPELAIGKHDHVQIDFSQPERETGTLIYSDPRRFGFMDLFTDVADCKFLANLGPEPLGNQLTADLLQARFENRRTPVKSALLDQSIIAGLGNIYVCEALWRSGISPMEQVGMLAKETGNRSRLPQLVAAIQDILLAAIEAGGSTLKDFRNADGDTGYFQHAFDVYGREGEPCHKLDCSGTVQRIVQAGRSSFFCPLCQPETG